MNHSALKVAILLLGGCLAGAASATRVWRNHVPGDSRCVQTGCTYSRAISNEVSLGIWVKDVLVDASSSSLISLAGTCHVNFETSKLRGFAISLREQKLSYHVSGDTADGTRKATIKTASEDMAWCRDGAWHFLMLTIDCEADETKLYLDGTCLVTDHPGLATDAPDLCSQFGGGFSSNTADTASPTRSDYGASVDFMFAEVTLYDRALAADEVAALTAKRADPFDRNLIGYWPGTDNSNWALHAARRADGSFVNAQPYYPQTLDDADILPFAYPFGRYVMTPEMAAREGYSMPTGTTFNALGCPATNLVEAFAATPQSTTLHLLSGTYYLDTCLTNTKAGVTLTSCNPSTGLADREGTVIDGSRAVGKVSALYRDATSGLAPTINGLTFANGPRALNFSGGGAFYVSNCTFTNLFSSSDCGAIYSYVRKGAVISNCLFQAVTGTKYGAVFAIQNADFSLDDYVTITHCRFENCLATGAKQQCGGAINSGRHGEILDCVFENCRTVSTASNYKGGAVYAGGCSNIRRCLFRNCGGSGTSSGYGMVMDLVGRNEVTDCTITAPDLASNGPGYGWIHCQGTGEITLANIVATNLPSVGSFVFPEACTGPVTLRQCLLGVASRGTGPRCFLQTHMTRQAMVENCTSDAQNAFATSGSFGGAAFENCLLGGSFPNAASATVTLTNCAVTATGGWTDGVNVWTRSDLGFVDAAGGDYTLKRNAFARDRGVRLDWMAGALDLARNPRLVDRSGVADAPDALPDLGCYEQQQANAGFYLMLH